MSISQVKDSDFDKIVLKSELPVLVDFWAEWCGPCRAIAPVLEKMALEYQQKVKFIKMNVDENPKAAEKWGVRAIPTLMLFRDGKLASSKIGSLPQSQLGEWLNSLISV